MNSLQTLTGLPSNHPNYLQDFNRRFKGGFLLMNGLPIQVVGEYTTFEYKCLDIIKKTQFLLNLKDVSPIYDIWIPEQGFYALQIGYVYIYQRPSRQYCRTFHPGSNYKIQCNHLQKNTTVYEDVFNKTIHTHKQYDAPDGYVLTNKLLIKLNTHINEFNLYYLQVPIGKVDTKTKTITLKHPVIMQEVQDSLNRIGEFGWTFK